MRVLAVDAKSSVLTYSTSVNPRGAGCWQWDTADAKRANQHPLYKSFCNQVYNVACVSDGRVHSNG